MDFVFDDTLNDSLETPDILNPNWMQECLKQRQALISKQKTDHITAYSVERQYINSKAWHDKFGKLPVNDMVKESLYRQTGRLLNFINNLDEEKQSQERLLAINARTGEFLVDNFDRDGETYKTGFNAAEYKHIEGCPDSIILVHNHSLNGRPSGQDLLAYLHTEKVKISIIACHDGNIYAIYGINPKFEEQYTRRYEKYKAQTNDKNEANRLATTSLYLLNEELPEKHKLFNVKQL